VGQVRMVISGASVNTFFLVLHKDIYRELPLLSFFDRSTELVNSTRGSHHTSPKPCAYVKALVSFSLSFSSLLYSGKSRMLKQVCAAGRCSLSGPMRWMKNFIDERPVQVFLSERSVVPQHAFKENGSGTLHGDAVRPCAKQEQLLLQLHWQCANDPPERFDGRMVCAVGKLVLGGFLQFPDIPFLIAAYQKLQLLRSEQLQRKGSCLFFRESRVRPMKVG